MSNEDKIRGLIESWARSVSAGNRKAILAHHSPNLVMFDFPNEIRGLKAYDKTWDSFFANPRPIGVFIRGDGYGSAGKGERGAFQPTQPRRRA
jgi:ketosteroid isomerase-like protein